MPCSTTKSVEDKYVKEIGEGVRPLVKYFPPRAMPI